MGTLLPAREAVHARRAVEVAADSEPGRAVRVLDHERLLTTFVPAAKARRLDRELLDPLVLALA